MKNIPVRKIAKEPSAEQFSIRKVQDISKDSDLVHELHRHDFFFVLAVENGEGVHEIDFKPYGVSDNALFFMRPGQVHQLMLKHGSNGYLMEFNMEFYRPESKQSRQRLLKASNKNFCKPETERFDKLHTILTSIFQEYTQKQEGHHEAIRANLELLLIELVRQSSDPGVATEANNYAQSRLEEFTELLDTHITQLKQASQYAQLMNLSLFQLNGITKSTVGKTASDLINEHIILEAKRYLLATTNQVKDVAWHLGYEDVSYFIRFFKKHTGFAPEAFRQKALS
jgi:AraC-like DNA-binding protein